MIARVLLRKCHLVFISIPSLIVISTGRRNLNSSNNKKYKITRHLLLPGMTNYFSIATQ